MPATVVGTTHNRTWTIQLSFQPTHIPGTLTTAVVAADRQVYTSIAQHTSSGVYVVSVD